MTLTWPVVLAVLFGALLHASWNALIKSGADKALDTALVHFMGALVALPFMLWFGLPARAAWPYILASLVIHIGYYVALVGAYRHGELGLTYPIMRGFAPLLVTLGSSAALGGGGAGRGGAASIGSYAIALWAMTRAPVASVAALRETSVLFVAVLATVLLGERFGWQRAVVTAVVVAGVMALRFG